MPDSSPTAPLRTFTTTEACVQLRADFRCVCGAGRAVSTTDRGVLSCIACGRSWHVSSAVRLETAESEEPDERRLEDGAEMPAAVGPAPTMGPSGWDRLGTACKEHLVRRVQRQLGPSRG